MLWKQLFTGVSCPVKIDKTTRRKPVAVALFSKFLGFASATLLAKRLCNDCFPRDCICDLE